MGHSTASLLLVDDDEDFCANLVDIFKELGYYKIFVAHDGLSGLQTATHGAFDLAMLDLKMPGMGGVDLCRELKKIWPGLAIIIITAYASDATETAARESGAGWVVEKPIDVPRLMRLVEAALRPNPPDLDADLKSN